MQKTKINILSRKASNIEEEGQSRPKKSNKRNSKEIGIIQSENKLNKFILNIFR